MEQSKRCHNCHFCAAIDSGYSNWTVMETTLHCLLGLNPFMPVEDSYSFNHYDEATKDHETFRVAEECPAYQYTANLTQIDVDGEELDNHKDDPAYFDLLNKVYGNN